jgi:hypothetical protein
MKLMTHVFSRWLASTLVFISVLPGSVHARTLKRVEQADFGKTKGGEDVKLITLRNSKG